MKSPGSGMLAQRSVPNAKSISTLLSLTDHGTTGAITNAGAALIRFDNDDLVDWHEGLMKIEVATTGGKGATPTAVGAGKTFSLFYAFTDTLLDATADAPTILQPVESALICALPNGVSARATGTLTITGTPSPGQTVTVGERVYRFEGVDLPLYYGYIRIGSTANEMRDRIIGAINADPVYINDTVGAGTVIHDKVVASSGGAGVVTLTAVARNTSGNSIATTENASNMSFGGATMSGGTAAGGAVFATDSFIHGGKYLYVWYDRDAFASANALIDVTAKLVRL